MTCKSFIKLMSDCRLNFPLKPFLFKSILVLRVWIIKDHCRIASLLWQIKPITFVICLRIAVLLLSMWVTTPICNRTQFYSILHVLHANERIMLHYCYTFICRWHSFAKLFILGGWKSFMVFSFLPKNVYFISKK